jgi:hypothetical protein
MLYLVRKLCLEGMAPLWLLRGRMFGIQLQVLPPLSGLRVLTDTPNPCKRNMARDYVVGSTNTVKETL